MVFHVLIFFLFCPAQAGAGAQPMCHEELQLPVLGGFC